MKPHGDPRRPVNLEDLLRVKRAERPDARFWDEFDRGLKQKQLAAIVEPKPWWLGFSLLAKRHVGWGIGGVATAGLAAAAIALLTPAFSPQLGSDIGVAVVLPDGGGPRTRDGLAKVTVGHISQIDRVSANNNEKEFLASLAPVVASASRSEAGGEGKLLVSAETALLVLEQAGASAHAWVHGLLSGENLLPVALPREATAEAESLGLAKSDLRSPVAQSLSLELDPVYEAEMDSFPPDAVVLPDSRQARLLASVDEFGSSHASLANVRDRVLHRMSMVDDAHDSFSRLGVSGDRLSLKF